MTVTTTPLIALLTDSTCGETCWNAREVACRCSCGGGNHGALLVDGAEQPNRNRRIKDRRYELATAIFIENDAYIATLNAVDDWIAENAPDRVSYWTTADGRKTYRNVKVPTTPGEEFYVHTAPRAALEKWPELAAWSHRANNGFRPKLIWRALDNDPRDR